MSVTPLLARSAPGSRVPAQRSSTATGYRVYAVALPLLLCGYMFFGRPFAYLHVPGIPVFVGELVLGIGLVETLPHLRVLRRAVGRSLAFRLLAALLVLTFTRLALVDVAAHGLDAARDAALVYYALNAAVVAVAVRLDPGLAGRWLHLYERVLPVYLCWAPISVALEVLYSPVAPRVPDSLTPIVAVKPGDVGVFCGMAIAYVWLRPAELGRLSGRGGDVWAFLGFVGLLVAGTQNRGGLLSGALIVAVALALSPRAARARTFYRAAAAFGVVLLLALAFDVRFDLGRREVSVEQLAQNLASLVNDSGPSDDGALGGTVSWRTRYWADIAGENLTGDAAATGVGYGVNLPERYGLQTPGGQQGLRNAHNSHLSVLARVGVPGLVLWTALWIAVGAAAVRRGERMRRQGAPPAWLLTWLGASLTGILFNAVFDPTLEGPQIGLWTWTLVGLLITASRVPVLAAYGYRDPSL